MSLHLETVFIAGIVNGAILDPVFIVLFTVEISEWKLHPPITVDMVVLVYLLMTRLNS